MQSIKKNIINSLILSISVIVIIFLISIIKKGSSVIVINFNFYYILLVILIVFSLWLIESIRYKILLNKFNYNFSIINLIYINLVSLFFATITPFGFGGFAMKVYMISKKKNFDIGQVSAIITIIYILNMLFVLFFSFISIFLLKNFEIKQDIIKKIINSVIIFIILLSIMIFIIILKPEVFRKISLSILNLFKKLSSEKKEKITQTIIRSYDRYREGLLAMKKLGITILWISIFTVIYYFVLLSITPLLIYSLNINVSYFTSSIMQFIYHFFVGWAVTPGGSGISEALYSSLFSSIVDISKLATLTFLFKFFTYYIYIILGGILSIKEIKEFGDLRNIYEYNS